MIFCLRSHVLFLVSKVVCAEILNVLEVIEAQHALTQSAVLL